MWSLLRDDEKLADVVPVIRRGGPLLTSGRTSQGQNDTDEEVFSYSFRYHPTTFIRWPPVVVLSSERSNPSTFRTTTVVSSRRVHSVNLSLQLVPRVEVLQERYQPPPGREELQLRGKLLLVAVLPKATQEKLVEFTEVRGLGCMSDSPLDCGSLTCRL